ncbi:MAG TPA: response regulator [Candidatus Angelobacter sp.]|nr:response regulator [Candidatus Angelobacter sp.]
MQRKVLIIDDEIHVADTLAMVLSAHGYAVRVEYCGEAGVRGAAEFFPDIVLSDVLMPDIDGVEVAQQIRRSSINCRIFLLSALPDHAHRLQHARGDGETFPVLEKPLDPHSLLLRLRSQAESGSAPSPIS